MASAAYEQILSLYGGNPQALRDAVNSRQADVSSEVLSDLNAALGGTTGYSGPGGAGVGLYPHTAPDSTPTPTIPPPPVSTSPGSTGAIPSMAASSAKATLAAMLAPYGLESLTQPAYDLQVSGLTDPTAMVLALENTQEFRARFPGMRDASTGQLIMTPAEYVSYEKSVRQLFADNGIAQPDQATIGSYVQNRRSVNELTTDVQAYQEIKNNPYVGDQFYAITGTHPGPEGVFALLTGQAPDLEKAYADSVAGGVDQATYAARLAQTPTGRDFTTGDIMNALQAAPNSLFNAGASPVNNMDKTLALQRAVAANAAEFKAGGQAAVSTTRLTTTF